MKRNEVTKCLLCNTQLNVQITWKALLTNAFPKTICLECEQTFELYENTTEEVLSLYQYNNAMKDFLHRYKFMHDVILAKVFRTEIHEKLSKSSATIVPIPLHSERQKERTFAQVDELLKASKISYEHFLEKTTTDTQVGKTRQERLAMPQFFKLIQNCKNKDILLIDDIYTTGATIQHARNLLLESGAKSVRAFTLIRG